MGKKGDLVKYKKKKKKMFPLVVILLELPSAHELVFLCSVGREADR